jgi:hypothetical protein
MNSPLHMRCGWCNTLLHQSPDPKAFTTTTICVECSIRVELDALLTALKARTAERSGSSLPRAH